MSTVKRITGGGFTIETVGASDKVYINSNSLEVANVLYGNTIVASKTSTFANVNMGNLSATGQVTAAVFVGDGTGITGIAAGNALGNIVSYGTSNVAIPVLSGNVRIAVGGIANVAVFSQGGANITGNIAADNYYWSNGQPFASGTVTYLVSPVTPLGANVGDFWFNNSNGILYQFNDDGDSNQWVDQSGVATPPATTSAVANSVIQRDINASATANIWMGNSVSVTGSITSGGFFIGNGSLLTGVQSSPASILLGTSNFTVVSSGGNITATVAGAPIVSISPSGIINEQGNGVGNIGSSSNYFNRVFATSTTALYADLAEVYQGDNEYVPGTVLIFGGNNEVTTTDQSHDARVAGVVSTEPAYLMNTRQSGVKLALTGRVPCLVQGPIAKGDMVTTSSVPGIAQAVDKDKWVPGCVIGKSLETIEDSVVQKIEIAVGRY